MGIKDTAARCGAQTLMPEWVPPGAAHYIAHTEQGEPIRALARAAGCHASTVLRQIRKVENRRDDPLVDAALRRLGAAGARLTAPVRARDLAKGHLRATPPDMPDDVTLTREAMRVLRRLVETGAVLAVATDLDKAVVVRDLPGQASARTAVVDANVAEAMALKDWITPKNTGRIVRYRITATGRQALVDMLKRYGATVAFEAEQQRQDAEHAEEEAGRTRRYGLTESPIAALGRRRDKCGNPFLPEGLVQAGERLREDYELARMDEDRPQDWDAFLKGTPAQPSPDTEATGSAAARAHSRMQTALTNLGPGLAEIALRCCCYLEGLETTEKRLGWSARSGKVVLKIALERLRLHYDSDAGRSGAMIG